LLILLFFASEKTTPGAVKYFLSVDSGCANMDTVRVYENTFFSGFFFEWIIGLFTSVGLDLVREV
jgi:hypothetical protein